MQLLDAEAVRAGLDPSALVEALRAYFADDTVEVPQRSHLALDTGPDTGSDAGPDGASEATLLLMPAWRRSGLLGVKIATHHPRNGDRGLPSIHGTYLLSELSTGRPVAVLDGTELTRWRTAAASALAADLLAPAQVRQHLILGAGNVAAAIPACYAAVRDVELTRVWARDRRRATALVADLVGQGRAAEVVEDLRAAVRSADVVTAATSATSPLVLGVDVRPGTHVDLIGSFTPAMIEADVELVARARVVLDVAEARHTAGELVAALAAGAVTDADLEVTLADVVRGRAPRRCDAEEITVFKAVGTAGEDLAAASLVWASRRDGGGPGAG